ncbi:MAG: D-alanyl-D-alanine carboxypeptidase family protein [Clostridia bacterium]
MKRIISLFLVLAFSFSLLSVSAEDIPMSTKTIAPTTIQNDITAKASVLMEAKTGKILFAKNENEPLPPASVTKIMTMLLTMEAVDSGKISLSDTTACSEYAASMGGSQVYLEPGEIMSVDELLKAVAVSSGNDAAVMLAELLQGSESDFVVAMNNRAKELNMVSTNFENCTGLPSANHKTSALDIAVMSRELLKHKTILNYTSIWMDTLRNGAFGLSNTNRLVRFYNGANGLKTGSTDEALYCVSATALRNNMQLISVILGGKTSDIRFNEASKQLDYGFAKFEVADFNDDTNITPVKVLKGKANLVEVKAEDSLVEVIDKGTIKTITKKIEIANDVKAPVEKGQKLGELVILKDNKELRRIPLVAENEIEKATVFSYFKKLLN